MSEAPHIPFSESKAPESADRLHRGALGLIDISASTMANIGPAYSFYFGFAGIVLLAGLASPLVVLVSLLVWGWIWGITGTLLAVPLTVLMIIVFAHIRALRPLALLLSDADSMKGLGEATRPD